MGLKKLVRVGSYGSAYMQVPYEWYDYVLLPFRVTLLVLVWAMVVPLMQLGKFLNWLANHPAVQPFDRRGSNGT